MFLPILTVLVGLVGFLALPAGEPNSKQRYINMIFWGIMIGGIIWTIAKVID